MAKVTQNTVKAYAKAKGLKAVYKPEWGEWAVGIKGRPEADYYCSDNAEALAQLEHFAKSI